MNYFGKINRRMLYPYNTETSNTIKYFLSIPSIGVVGGQHPTLSLSENMRLYVYFLIAPLAYQRAFPMGNTSYGYTKQYDILTL